MQNTSRQTINMATVPAGNGRIDKIAPLLADVSKSNVGSPEAEIAFTNPLTSERYVRLQARGLNNLRSEIIATCEYIPAGTGELTEKSAQFQFKLGDNSTISVNNVARLIELHRQIRMYIIDATEQLFERTFPDICNKEFTNFLSNFIDSNFDDLIAGNINDTVESLFLALQEQENNFRQVLSANKDNPMLLAIIEYFTYEQIVESLIAYLGTVSATIKKAGSAWQLSHYSLNKDFATGALEAFRAGALYSLPPAMQSVLIAPTGARYDLKVNNLFKTPQELEASLLGLQGTGALSHTDFICISNARLASAMALRDSAGVIRNSGKLASNVDHKKIPIGYKNDLANAIAELKKISLRGLFYGIPDADFIQLTSDEFNSLGVNDPKGFSLGIPSVSGGDFTTTKINNIINSIETETGDIDRINSLGEVMAALLIDQYTHIATTKHIDNYPVHRSDISSESERALESESGYSHGNPTHQSLDDHFGFEGFSGNTVKLDTIGPNHIRNSAPTLASSTYFDFIEQVLGIPEESLRINRGENYEQNIQIDRDPIPTSSAASAIGFGKFGSAVANARTSEFGSYSPTESSTKEATTNKASGEILGLIPALENFIQKPLIEQGTSGTINFTEAENWVNSYAQNANYLHSLALTMFPHRSSNYDTRNSSNTYSPTINNTAFDLARHFVMTLSTDLYRVATESADTDNTHAHEGVLSLFLRERSESSVRKMIQSVVWGVIRQSSHKDTQLAKSADAIARMEVKVIEEEFESFLTSKLGVTAVRSSGTGVDNLLASGETFDTYLTKTGTLLKKKHLDPCPDELQVNPRKDVLGTPPISTTVQHDKVDEYFDAQLGPNVENIGYGGNAFSLIDMLSDVRQISESCGSAIGFGKILENTNNLLADFTFGRETGSKHYKTANYPLTGDDFDLVYQLAEFDRPVQSLYNPDFTPLNNGVTGTRDKVAFMNSGIFDVSGLLRVAIANYLMYYLIRDHVGVKIDTNYTTNRASASIMIHLDNYQLIFISEGLKSAVRQSSHNTTTANNHHNAFLSFNNCMAYYAEAHQVDDFEGRGLEEAFAAGLRVGNIVLDAVKTHQDNVREKAMINCFHAESLKTVLGETTTAVQGKTSDGEISKPFQLSKNLLMEFNLYEDVLTLNNSLTTPQLVSCNERLFRTKEKSLLPKDMQFMLNKHRLMHKVLTEPGYGLLEDEKYGNKTILNVGLPNSMVESLQKLAVESTANLNYQNSPYVCISIFKKDHINHKYQFLPKNFVFDTSAFINDSRFGRPDSTALPHHLRMYNENDSFQEVLKKIEITRSIVTSSGKIHTKVAHGYPSGVFHEEVMVNHVFDYFLKEYMLTTTGLNFNEETFLLLPSGESPINFNKINPTEFVGEGLTQSYLEMLGKLDLLYPEASIDEQLKNELFRMTRMIKQALPFSFSNRFKQMVYPKAFDRVFSLVVNEKDFIVDINKAQSHQVQADSNEDYAFLFNSVAPSFHMSGKLQRPAFVASNDITENTLNNFKISEGNFNNYLRSLDNNHPEVYQYHAVVSLLPLEFISGAKVYLSQEILDRESEASATASSVSSERVAIPASTAKNEFRRPIL